MSKNTQVRHQIIRDAAVAANTGVHAAITLPSSGTTVVTTSITNPDVPRTIRLKGNQATTQGLVVTIEGTDILDNAISEDVTMGGAFATPTDSLNAFKTVTKITVPTRGGASDTISVGLGASLAFDCYLDADSIVLNSTEVTSKTVDAAVISKNVFVPSATLNGSTDVILVYVPYEFPKYERFWG